MKRKYDLAFGIGQSCGCSQSLRRANLQYLSFPGDWTAPIWGGGGRLLSEQPFLRHRADVLCDGDADFFRAEDFFFERAIESTQKDVYINRRTLYIFNHDFPMGGDFRAELPKVAAKYDRRRARLMELIGRSARVLAVCVDIPGGKHPTSLDDCRYARERFNRRFAPTKFDFCLFSDEPGRSFADRTFEEVEPGLFHLSFGFLDPKHALPNQPDLRLTGAALAELFEVADYRTEEEKARFAEQKRREKLAKCARRRQARLQKLVNFWHGGWNLLYDLQAHRRQRKFEQVAFLGATCEAAFRFYCRWKFLDSSLFAWSGTMSLSRLADVVSDLSRLGTGDFSLWPNTLIWKCENTGFVFHGKYKGVEKPTDEELAADREDLRARLAHLKEKFVRYLTNEKPTLFIYRIAEKDEKSSDLAGKFARLEAVFEGLGARNWTILAICEREWLPNMPVGALKHTVFRAVNRFNPTTEVTNRRKGDPAGWQRIFTEFAPLHLLKKAHAFKFEQH